MTFKSYKLLFISLFLILILVPGSIACGCGLAIADMKVFNALKETQAYLLIDVEDENSYTEMPFFRMVSMEEVILHGLQQNLFLVFLLLVQNKL